MAVIGIMLLPRSRPEGDSEPTLTREHEYRPEHPGCQSMTCKGCGAVSFSIGKRWPGSISPKLVPHVSVYGFLHKGHHMLFPAQKPNVQLSQASYIAFRSCLQPLLQSSGPGRDAHH